MNIANTKISLASIIVSFSVFALQCEPSGNDPVQSEILVNKLIVDNIPGTAHRAVRSDALVRFPQFVLGGEYVTYREDYRVETASMKSRLVREPAFKMVRIDGTDDRILVSGKFHDSPFPLGDISTFVLRGRPAISLDGTAAAIILDTDAGLQRLIHVGLQSALVTQLSESSPTVEFSEPCFSSDGSNVIFVRTTSSGASSLLSLRISDRTLTTIWSSDTSRIAWPQPIASSDRLLFVESISSASKMILRMARTDTINVTRIDEIMANHVTLPVISQDGGVIAYYSTSKNLYLLIHPDGSIYKELSIYPHIIKAFISPPNSVLVERPSTSATAILDVQTSSFSDLSFVFYEWIAYSRNNGLFVMDTLFIDRKLSN